MNTYQITFVTGSQRLVKGSTWRVAGDILVIEMRSVSGTVLDTENFVIRNLLSWRQQPK